MLLQNRVAIVTGATRGIGKQIAETLASEGSAVAVHYNSGKQEADNIVAEIKERGGSAESVKADIRFEEEVREMVEIVSTQLGPIDILVNNARQLGVKKSFLNLNWSDYEHQMDVILKGTFFCCKTVLPIMIDRKSGGKIINILSTVMEEPNWRWHCYGAAKGALWQLTRHLASEVGKYDITVNMVSPGFTQTERKTQHDSPYLKNLLDQTPMQRFASTEDIANAVLFLSSNQAGFITGANIPVCGGKFMN